MCCCNTHPFYAIGCEPVEGFDEEEETEYEREGDVEFITEDGKCQQRFGNEEPQSIVQTLYLKGSTSVLVSHKAAHLHFRRSQRPKEYLLEDPPKH